MISCDEVYNKLVCEYCIEKVFSREEIISSIAFLGALKLMNDEERLELNFKGLSLESDNEPIYDFNIPSIKETELIDTVLRRTKNSESVNIEPDKVKEYLCDAPDYYNLCNGHDFILAFKCCADRSGKSFNEKKDKDLEAILRSAFHLTHFKRFKLFESLKDWAEKSNVSLFVS